MALEVVGGAILSSVLNVMLERMASRELMDLLRKKQPIAELLEKLKTMLRSANAVLNDAEDKQIRDEHVKNWVDELNDVLLKADDVIDEINTEALRREIEGSHQPRCSMRKILVNLIPVSSVAFDKAIKPEIENVLERLKFVLDQKDYLGLRGVQSKRLQRSPAPLITDPSEVYGRENEKEAIVDLLLSKNINGGDDLSVIPIVGMGGIGKTTLARLIYNDSRVKNHFEHRAWVTVSDDFDVQRLARLVFKELTSKEPTTEELGKLRDNLKVELSGQKFFLVLDDVWNKNYGKWNEFMSFLKYGAIGCKIIVTTRNEDVASVTKTGSVPLYSLTTMSDGDCLRLLNKHVSYNVNSGVNQCLKEIVKKCKGLPLAVMSMAGLLRSLSDPKDWNDILESDVWDLHKKGDYEILPSLWLSYSYLPPHVKRCFAYCSIFPKDYKYKREEMLLLWMAEGLLEGENMKEVGGKCLNMLISRSLLQRSSEDETVLLMHDLVHDLAMFVTGKGYCAILDDVKVKSITNKTRHVSFKYKAPDTHSFKDLAKAEGLRTFLCLAPKEYRSLRAYNNNADVLIKKFGCLRVLCPLITSNLEVPDSIGNLKHLRYLDLSWTLIERLPDTICTLYNLQTLLLCHCRRLTRLPGNIDRLINLRHLDISETDSLEAVPPGIFKLKSLHITLSRLVLSDKQSGSRIKELGKRLHWREKLEISRLGNVVDVNDVLEAEFQNISGITDLRLSCSYRDACDSQKEREVLDALRPHHANLKTLEVCDYRGKQLSDWIGDLSFSHTTEVSLISCTECCYLPPFGQLPSLKKLEIKGLDSIETISSEFYGSADSTPFISLETLNFSFMDKWRCWSLDGDNELEAGAFPCLKELTLYNCPKLNSPLPHCLPSLRELKISRCYQMEALLPSGQLMNTAFPSVEKIELRDCPELECMGWPFPASLHKLSLSYSCGKLWEQHMHWGLQALGEMTIQQCVDLFPEEGLLPATLVRLRIGGAPHLKALNGKGFQHLTCLERLFIYNCPVLQCLPEEGLPASLSTLHVWGCPLLKPRLEKEKGEDWHKISHIRDIFVV